MRAGATFDWLFFLRQFKSDKLRRLEGLVFEKKKFITKPNLTCPNLTCPNLTCPNLT